jgi:hypothetical protein
MGESTALKWDLFSDGCTVFNLARPKHALQYVHTENTVKTWLRHVSVPIKKSPMKNARFSVAYYTHLNVL